MQEPQSRFCSNETYAICLASLPFLAQLLLWLLHSVNPSGPPYKLCHNSLHALGIHFGVLTGTA